MDQERILIWLQMGSIIALYIANTVALPDANRFVRVLSSAPIGVLAGYGFMYLYKLASGDLDWSTFKVGQIVLLVLPFLAVIYVIWGLTIIINKLINPRKH